jgi:ribosomal protein L11 methyltransferase
MQYTQLYLHCSPEAAEILTAELAQIGFDTFTDEPDGLKAYIPDSELDMTAVAEVFDRYSAVFEISFTTEKIAQQNWNATWEQNYPPIQVGQQVYVRASFHEPMPGCPYDIVINPKMSFGTGHHDTTHMMLAQQLGINHQGKHVLDIGCGTGILAIMAAKLGAARISAFDIEEWAALNSIENAQLNDCKHITVRQGTIEDEPPGLYDLLLANINRNILLRDIGQYIRFLKPGGLLLVSGFYEQDSAQIETHFSNYQLKKTKQLIQNQWTCLQFESAN